MVRLEGGALHALCRKGRGKLVTYRYQEADLGRTAKPRPEFALPNARVIGPKLGIFSSLLIERFPFYPIELFLRLEFAPPRKLASRSH